MPTPDPETAQLLDAMLRCDFATFAKGSFAVVNPDTELIWAPYLDLVSAKLAKVASGEIRNLIVTMPPRHLKSLGVSVALPAFFLGQNPAAEVMVVSYGQDLARDFAEDSRKVMASPFYERVFPTRLFSPRQSPQTLRTLQGGVRRATSIEGVATGVGADLLIFDDPQKPGEALSDAVRASTNSAYENTFLSRRNDPATCRTVIVMQRLHEDDFVGHVLGLGGEWEVINLPAIAEEAEVYPFETALGRQTFRRAEGEALHPARVSLETLAEIRAGIGEAAWASQYQQRPAPAGGGIVNTAWFKRYVPAELPEPFDEILQSWDTANKVEDWHDFSVCTTWGRKGKDIYLLGLLRRRMQYPDLKKEVRKQALLWRPTTIVIEDRASGTQLIQELRMEDVPYIQPHSGRGDKKARMAAQTARIEAGFVHLPADAHWLAEYLHELAMFPNGKFDDQVDSTSQALEWFVAPEIKGLAFLELARQANRNAGNLNRKVVREVEYAKGSMEYEAQQALLAEVAAEAETLRLAA